MVETVSQYPNQDEPRSKAQADLGGGMATYYRTGRLAGQGKPRKPSAQRMHAQLAAEESARLNEQPIKPTGEALAHMSPEDKAAALDQIRAVKAVLHGGELALGETFTQPAPAEEPLGQQRLDV